MCDFDQIKNGHVCFIILVLCLMLLMRGEEDKSDNEGQEQVADNLDSQIDDEMEDSQSTASASSNTVTTPPLLTPCRRPTPGKRMHCGHNKRDAIEERLLKIIEQPEKEPDEDEKFCQSLATSLRGKIQDPQRKEYTKLRLQRTMYDCMYGSQPNVGLNQPQQVPMPMSHHQQSYNYSVNSDGSTFTSFYNVYLKFTNIQIFKCES